MNCNISFKLGGETITIENIKSDVDLSSITRLSELSELMATNEGNSSLVVALEKIDDYHRERSYLAEPKYIKGTGVSLPLISMTGSFSSQELMEAEELPNRTVAQVLSAVNTSSYNDSFAAQFVNLALTELSPSLEDTDRIITFVTDKLTDGYGNEIKGFFDKNKNQIFVRVSDENHLDPSDIEGIAHELVHYIAFNNNVSAVYYWNRDQVDKLLALSSPNKQIQARLDVIANRPGISLKAEEILAESYSNKEFNDFLKVNGFSDLTSSIKLDLEKYDYNSENLNPPKPDASEDTLFSKVSEGVDLVPITQVLKGIDKESHAKVAETIRKEFEAHKKFIPAGSKYSSLDLNYDESMDITDTNGRTQILSLKQRDLVEVPFFEWDSKKKQFVVKTGKDAGASFRPIIKRFFDKNGDLMITVPASDKSNADSFDLRADEFALRYRVYLGEMNATPPSANQITAAVLMLGGIL